MNADNQEAWVEHLNQKYHVMRQLYIENEALLNRYVRPFLEGGEELTEPVAQEFIDQIWQAFSEGFEDSLTMMEVAEALEDYFREKGALNYYIWDLSILGILYNGSSQIEEGRKGFEYFEKLAAFRDRYFGIRDFEVRKRIIYAFYNRPVLLTNFFLAEADELNFYLDQALDFYNDVKVRKLDGRKFDFDGLIEELNYDVLGNYVMSHDKDNSDRNTLERAEKSLKYTIRLSFRRTWILLKCRMRYIVITRELFFFWENSAAVNFWMTIALTAGTVWKMTLLSVMKAIGTAGFSRW